MGNLLMECILLFQKIGKISCLVIATRKAEP
nr:MAG TPA: hypothetical protein [Bacteriophage sp.]DAM25898.1 MAG TPA: hypothetical protein [Caudoviricetes sp.]DAM99906.1 MAG TPA: hypothetical protein [Caudoviricetes sp.]DAU72050.1 MAG TPA: hypothetical protein [Caudoviricetes sp.]DAZ69821.1 MAG TPA: hypothetical protein [Caudoviricetes sp.]